MLISIVYVLFISDHSYLSFSVSSICLVITWTLKFGLKKYLCPRVHVITVHESVVRIQDKWTPF